MSTVIIGAGIIGCSTAFYLSQSPSNISPSDIHLVESSPELFASASGYAAGFLARDWFSSSSASLGALSFDLHKELAEENNGMEKWGYSRSTGTSMVEVTGKRGDEWLRDGTSRAEVVATHHFEHGYGPAWLTRSKNGKVEIISRDDSTAQVYVTLHTYCMSARYRNLATLELILLLVTPSAYPNFSWKRPALGEFSSTSPLVLYPSLSLPPVLSCPLPLPPPLNPLPQP